MKDKIKGWYSAGRRWYAQVVAWPWVARIMRASFRYQRSGLRFAAGSATYFGVLTLLPFLALLYGVGASLARADPRLNGQLSQALAQGLGVQVDLGAQLFTAQAKAALHAVFATLGATGVLYAGRYWVDAYRRALRAIWWPNEVRNGSYLWRYVRDVLVLLLFVAATLLLFGFGVVAMGGPFTVLAAHGHALPGWAEVVIRLTAVVVMAGWGALICAGLFYRLGRAPHTRGVRQAVLLGGLCAAVLVVGGLRLLREAFQDPVYGIVVAILSMMLWISTAVRLTLMLAVWADEVNSGESSGVDAGQGRGETTAVETRGSS